MEHNEHSSAARQETPYRKLLLMVLLSFAAMYILMYAMVDSFENVFSNVSQFYMAGLMTGAMLLIEIVLMRQMYRNRRLNFAIILSAILLTVLCFFFIRRQAAVGDRQFLRSMIPHHGAAVLMVKEARLKDPEIQALADSIIAVQEKEIKWMREKLRQQEGRQLAD